MIRKVMRKRIIMTTKLIHDIKQQYEALLTKDTTTFSAYIQHWQIMKLTRLRRYKILNHSSTLYTFYTAIIYKQLSE